MKNSEQKSDLPAGCVERLVHPLLNYLTTMKKSKIRRKAKRQAERDTAALRAKFLHEIDAPKRRLEAEIAARGNSRMNKENTHP